MELADMRIEISSDGALLGSRCKKCGAIFYPKKLACLRCLVEETLELWPLSKRGRLYSYTISEIAPPGFAAPYAFGYIDLPEKVRVFGRIKCPALRPESLKPGMELEIELEMAEGEGGQKFKGYFFKPVGN